MCGIVGVASFNNYGIGIREKDIFKELLIADTLRGKDGTGVIVVDNNFTARSLKIGGTPDELFADKKFNPFWEKNRDKWEGGKNLAKGTDLVLIGHNRWASVGGVSTDNAHPHVHKHIHMVHNGTLRDHSRLPGIKTAEVDSMALVAAIAEMGIDEAIKNTFGSYSIVYYDENENTLNFLRNSERPMHILFDEVGKKLYWASEGPMLKWILTRNSVTSSTPIAVTKPDILMSFAVEAIEWNRDVRQLVSTKEVKGPVMYQYYRNNDFGDYVDFEICAPASVVQDLAGTVPRSPIPDSQLPVLLTPGQRVRNWRNGTPPAPTPLPVVKEEFIQVQVAPNRWEQRLKSQHTTVPQVTAVSLESLDKEAGKLPKPERKRVKKALNILKNSGIACQIISEHYGLKKGENIPFKVKEYIDGKNRGEFVILGESTLFPDTAIKLRVNSFEKVEELLSNPYQIAKINNMVHYPENKAPNDYLYVVWVSDAFKAPPPNVDEDAREAALLAAGRTVH